MTLDSGKINNPLRINAPDTSGELAKVRAKVSASVAPVPKKEDTAVTDSALKLVDSEADKPGLLGLPSGMSGIGALGFISKKLEHEILTNENARDSRFVQGAYAFCKMFESMFGSAFTADDYMSFATALYPTEKLEFKDETQIKKFLDEMTDLELLDNYQKTKKEIDRTVDGENKDKLKVELGASKKAIEERFGDKGKDPDALCKKYLDKNKEKLTDEELEKFKDKDLMIKDAQISTYYVQKQLNILGLVKENQNGDYDPLRLYSGLEKTAYEDSDKKKHSMFEFKGKGDSSEVRSKFDAETLATGTVVFFRREISEGKPALMCGIIGLDGKLRFHDSKGLHVFGDVKTDAEKYADIVIGKRDDADSSEDVVDKNDLFGSFLGSDMLPTSSFAGAFIPHEKKEEPEDTVASAEEKKKEDTKPVDEKKPETEKPAESSATSQS